MSDQTYVIRGYHFGYNDECFYVCGSSINTIYHNKEEAELKYKALEVEYARNTYIGDEGSIFDADSRLIQKIDDYVFEKTGIKIAKDGYIESGTQLPSKMSDEEVFEFTKLADIHAYKLVAFEGKPVFYALWDIEEEKYQYDYDEYYTGLVYAESREGAIANLQSLMEDKKWATMQIAGTLEELSPNPILLEQLIKTSKCFTYDQSQPSVRVKKAKAKDIAALNELLNQPLFELRELDPQTIIEIEKNVRKEYEYDEY